MAILITGSSGFLGRALKNRICSLFPEDGIIEFNRSNNYNLLNPGDIRKIIGRIETVFHLAGILNYSKKNDAALDFNFISTFNLFEAGYTNIRHFIYASSQDVYNLPAEGNCFFCETNNIIEEKLTPYGKSKLLGEKVCLKYGKKYGINIVIARIANVYGAGMHQQSTLYTLIHEAKNIGQITLYGRGNRAYDLIYNYDVADALIRLRGKNGIYNLGGLKKYTIKDIALILRKIYRCKLIWDETKKEKPGIWLDCSKIVKEISFHSLSLEEGLKEIPEANRG